VGKWHFAFSCAAHMVKMPILMIKGTHIIENHLAVCDKTRLADLNRDDIYISESTFHYNGGVTKSCN
jgi:hypothetical protein